MSQVAAEGGDARVPVVSQRPVEAGAGEASEGAASTDVSVIIANYNACERLRACLESVARESDSCRLEVIVVDDASTDGSAEMVRAEWPDAVLIVNRRNHGYGASCNLAVERAQGRFVYLLNNDVEVERESIASLLGFMRTHDDVAAVGSLLLNPDRTVQANAAKSLPSWRSVVFGYRSVVSRWFPDNRWTKAELVSWRAHLGEPFAAEFVSSAAMMLRTRLLRELGGLDAEFFHFIDADLCRRIRKANGRIYCLPSSRAVHHEHGGGSMIDPARRFRTVVDFHRGAYRYYRKHSGRPPWHPMHWFVAIGIAVRCGLLMSLQTVKEIAAVVNPTPKGARE